MANEESGGGKPVIPDTTQKKEGTTSAFSAASIDKSDRTAQKDLKKNDGTDAEHDELNDREERDDTVGIP